METGWGNFRYEYLHIRSASPGCEITPIGTAHVWWSCFGQFRILNAPLETRTHTLPTSIFPKSIFSRFVSLPCCLASRRTVNKLRNDPHSKHCCKGGGRRVGETTIHCVCIFLRLVANTEQQKDRGWHSNRANHNWILICFTEACAHPVLHVAWETNNNTAEVQIS